MIDMTYYSVYVNGRRKEISTKQYEERKKKEIAFLLFLKQLLEN